MGAGKLDVQSYYSVMGGKVCRQFKSPTKDSITRVNKNGKTVHEEFYDYIDGVMVGIVSKDSDFGRFWIIQLMDGQNVQMLQLNYSSGYSNAFLKTLPNIDLNKKIVLIPKETIEPDGKKKTTLFVTQDGVPIKWYYTKDNPNGIPELIVKEGKGKNKGKKIYDDSEIMEFLEEMVNTDIVPNLPSKQDAISINSVPLDEEEEVDEEDEVEEEDDIPETLTKGKGKKKDKDLPF